MAEPVSSFNRTSQHFDPGTCLSSDMFLDSSCIPESGTISQQKKRRLEELGRTDGPACNETSINGYLLPKYSRSQEKLSGETSDSQLVNGMVDTNSIASSCDTEIEIDTDYITSSDDELPDRTSRFNRLSTIGGPSTPSLHEPACIPNDLLKEASARFRSSLNNNPNPTIIVQESRQSTTDPADLVESIPDTRCRLPFNNHREDYKHYRFCPVITTGIILRKSHTNWLNDIPSHSSNRGVVDMITGSSCEQYMMTGECENEQCPSKTSFILNVPNGQPSHACNVFIKWFLLNAEKPNLKVMLLVLSFVAKYSQDTLMVVLSFAQMLPRTNSRHWRALGIKLIDIMVNKLKYKPWEAVRSLLSFIVTPETPSSEIVDLLSSFELTKSNEKSTMNHVYDSMSCLWHLSTSFQCPANVLFQALEETLVQMPAELKLTKDRMLANLLKLPRAVVLGKFHLVDKFLSKYYPQNSGIAHLVRTSILYNVVTLAGCTTYESSRVKGTGPVNTQWDHWDIREAQIRGFDAVIKTSIKDRHQDETPLRLPMDLSKEELDVDVWMHDQFKIISSHNILSYERNLPTYDFSANTKDDFQNLEDALNSGKYRKVAKILSLSWKSNSFEKCLQVLERELELGERNFVSLLGFEVLYNLPGSLLDTNSVKSCFVRLLNSFVLKFYKEMDFKSALKLIKSIRNAGVNHLQFPPQHVNEKTFTLVCCDIHFQCRLYPEAIRSLSYDNCLNILRSNKSNFDLVDKIVKKMLGRFLKERHASYANEVFRLVLTAQKSLHSPLDIGKFYEGVIFLSFVNDSKENALSTGNGANLYIMVERLCGNSEAFHAITYRSLLVELHRANSPEDIIRRVLRICLKKGIYPDFTRGPKYPLVLTSHLAQDEMLIYLKHYFNYFIAQNTESLLSSRSFVVKFLETPQPNKKLFPVPNDIMKTSRNVPDAVARLKTVLKKLSPTLEAEFSTDCVTISEEGVGTLLGIFKQ